MDRVRSKRLILVIASAVLACGAVLLSWTAAPWAVYTAQLLIGGAGPFLAPTLAAVTMGLVGRELFDREFDKNQSFNSAGNVFCALLIGGVSRFFGNRVIFVAAALLTISTVLSVIRIRSNDIEYELARGGVSRESDNKGGKSPSQQHCFGIACCLSFWFAHSCFISQMQPCSRNSGKCSPRARVLPLPRSCRLASS